MTKSIPHDEGARRAERADTCLEAVAGEEERLPLGLPRVVLILLAVAAAWVAVQGGQELKEIIAPVFFGVNLIIAAYPIKQALTQRGVPQVVGAICAGLVVLVVVVAFVWALVWAVYAFVREMPHYGPKFNQLWSQSLELLSRFGIDQVQLEQGLKGLDPSSFLGMAQSFLSSLSGVASMLVVVATVLIFLVMDIIGFGGRLAIARDHNPVFVGALSDFARGVRRYWVISTVFGLIVAVLDLGALLILGVPLALVWAVLSFVTNYIPNVGFVIGLIPPALMALLEKGWQAALIVVVAYSVLNFVVQSVIQPKFAGDAVGVTPTISFLSLLFWAWVLGPLGAILALPATLLCKAILVDADPEVRWINAFIAAKPKSAGVPLRRRRRPEAG